MEVKKIPFEKLEYGKYRCDRQYNILSSPWEMKKVKKIIFLLLSAIASVQLLINFPVVKLDNVIWQVMWHPKGDVKILNAYLDLRQNKSVVRINVSSVPLNNSDVVYCQFWYNDRHEPTVVRAVDILQMRRENIERFECCLNVSFQLATIMGKSSKARFWLNVLLMEQHRLQFLWFRVLVTLLKTTWR